MPGPGDASASGAEKIFGLSGWVYGAMHRKVSAFRTAMKARSAHRRRRRRILSSGLFDEDYYLAHAPEAGDAATDALDHFISHGGRRGRSPSAMFDAFWYVSANRDVARSGRNPLLHYLEEGCREGRRPRFGSGPAVEFVATLVDARDVEELPNDERARALERVSGASPRVSVIVPTWNRKSVVVEAVRSALTQSWLPHEVIVADDGSDDGTIAHVEAAFSQEIGSGTLKLLALPHKGVSAARNIALDAAEGDTIAFLDSDNTWRRDHLLAALDALLADRGTSIVYTAVRKQDRTGHRSGVISQAFDRRCLLFENFIDLNSLVHEKEVGAAIRFDPDISGIEDWDYLIRLTRNRNAKLVPLVTVDYFLDEGRLKNLTYTENIRQHINHIKDKHYGEFVGLARTAHTPDAPAPSGRRYPLAVILDRREDAAIAEKVLGVGFDFDAIFLLRQGSSEVFEILDSGGDGSSEARSRDNLPDGVYWYPDFDHPLPAADQIAAAFLSVWLNRLHIACISYSLARDETICVNSLRNQCFVDRSSAVAWIAEQKLGLDVRGRVLHVPPAPHNAPLHSTPSDALIGAEAEHRPQHGEFWCGRGEPSCAYRGLPDLGKPERPGRKPTVLIFAMKLAVGGAERNIIEVCRALRNEYDFIYLTTERITEANGTLADQVREACYRLVDMAEITGHHRYLELLQSIKDVYAPDLVWICNGSMWLCDNALRVRSLFEDTPIVDQQVYDAQEGWIRRYQEPGVQSFDRYVAINSAIERRFVDDFGMAPDTIDLVYHAIAAERFREFRKRPVDGSDLKQKFGLPERRKLFVQVGRLTVQKRPLDFLELSERRIPHTDEHFVLVGNGELAGDVEHWLAQRERSNVQWIPHVERIEELFAVASGIVVTSDFEGLPIVMLEALSMGVPVLSTDVGDVRLVLEEYGAGLIVGARGNPAALSKAFEEWVSRLDEFRANLETGSEAVLARFSARSVGRAYDRCWKQAMNSRPEMR